MQRALVLHSISLHKAGVKVWFTSTVTTHAGRQGSCSSVSCLGFVKYLSKASESVGSENIVGIDHET